MRGKRAKKRSLLTRNKFQSQLRVTARVMVSLRLWLLRFIRTTWSDQLKKDRGMKPLPSTLWTRAQVKITVKAWVRPSGIGLLY